MNLAVFSLFTLLGTVLWNGLLVGLGAALGTQYELIDQYSQWLDVAVYTAIGGVLVWLVVRRRRRTGAVTAADGAPADPLAGVSTKELRSRAASALVQTDEELLGEGADLLYHLIVLLRARGLSLADVERVLAARGG